jgi:hypothetical protein
MKLLRKEFPAPTACFGGSAAFERFLRKWFYEVWEKGTSGAQALVCRAEGGTGAAVPFVKIRPRLDMKSPHTGEFAPHTGSLAQSLFRRRKKFAFASARIHWMDG